MYKFDYNQMDWQFVSRIMNENSLRLSRTRKGISNTETSADKLPLKLTGDKLRAKSAENETLVHRIIFDARNDAAPQSGREVLRLLGQIADTTNKGLLPAGRYTKWDVGPQPMVVAKDGSALMSLPPKIWVGDVKLAVSHFCDAVYRRWNELESGDRVPLAAWAEWQLNGGSLHPSYDGCGRISRSFSAMLLIGASTLLPLYDNTTTYFKCGNWSKEEFCDYMRRKIEDCAVWLETQSRDS